MKTTFTAVIMEINERNSARKGGDTFKETISEISEKIGYQVVETIELPFDVSAVRKKVADLVDNQFVGLIFVRNRGMYSLNEELFDLEDRMFRDTDDWKRIWSRQRILYNTFNHAITVVREHSLIMNFEGEFASVNGELAEILEIWKENCILYENDEKKQLTKA